MKVGNGAVVHGGVPEGEGEDGIDSVEDDQEKHGTDDVEVQVDGGALGVFGGTDAGQDGSDAGADVLAHDDGHSGGEGHHAGGGQCLENGHRGRGALNEGGDGGANRDPQNGVGEPQEQLLEGLQLCERSQGAFHGFDADEQKTQADENLPHRFFHALIEKGEEQNAHEGQNGSKHFRLEQGEKKIFIRQSAQPENLSRDGGADVGAHDDTHRLPELQDTSVDKANAHDGGRGGGVDHAGHHRAQQYTLQDVVGQPLQHGCQLSAGQLFQTRGHGGHSE